MLNTQQTCIIIVVTVSIIIVINVTIVVVFSDKKRLTFPLTIDAYSPNNGSMSVTDGIFLPVNFKCKYIIYKTE